MNMVSGRSGSLLFFDGLEISPFIRWMGSSGVSVLGVMCITWFYYELNDSTAL